MSRPMTVEQELLDRLTALLECVEDAIRAGDWKVDGACDPDPYIYGAKVAIQRVKGELE